MFPPIDREEFVWVCRNSVSRIAEHWRNKFFTMERYIDEFLAVLPYCPIDGKPPEFDAGVRSRLLGVPVVSSRDVRLWIELSSGKVSVHFRFYQIMKSGNVIKTLVCCDEISETGECEGSSSCETRGLF